MKRCDAAEAVALARPVVDGEHRLHAERLDLLAGLDEARIVLGGQHRGHVVVVELVERHGQELEAGVVLELGEQVVRLAAVVDEAGDLARLHLLERDGVVDEDRLDLDAEPLEQDRARWSMSRRRACGS